MPDLLSRTFFERSAIEVARDLLGARLVRWIDGRRMEGSIIEAEAYQGEEDLACHAKAGRTARTRVMYGPPGHAYVYFTYGAHWMLNVVTERVDYPAAVLIRGIEPLDGLDTMAEQRPAPLAKDGKPRSAGWTDGPAKLTQALAITGSLNGIDLCSRDSELYLEAGERVPDERVRVSTRIGIESVPEPWKSKPWRFFV
jgi:DNA-3-methyladenine glycosylase